jgi:hypothetical protein
MQKPITPYAHGLLDYATSATLVAAPRLMQFPPSAERACYALAGGYTGLSLFTDYPLSVKRAIPFKAHGLSELLVGAVLPMLPWMLGFARHRRAMFFFIGLTAVTAATALLTDWDRKSERAAARRHVKKPRLVPRVA